MCFGLIEVTFSCPCINAEDKYEESILLFVQVEKRWVTEYEFGIKKKEMYDQWKQNSNV